MLKIVTVCGAGVGSSMMMRLFTQQILDDEKIEAVVDAADIGSVDPNGYDILITTSDFADTLRDSTAQIVRIDNMMDKDYLKEQLLKTINELGG
ncbi:MULTISPECIES: PTS sugar transporter subunit IIB [Enterococcus]|uniref:PTS sugar transporter subunit IIB n=1 Tax=Candidatus Enterococcus murrayae TaxID=2815321 RepID=A0ABS3HHQ1_9ENTE|nr:PTS sugar transporter subunit IIB [Enterococcus sp. MJM16]MBO0452982.1 PTS sugar transporter subunit IIB [Enterococcus sp. MJM16]